MPGNDAINPSHYKGVLVIPANEVKNYIKDDGSLSLEYIEVMRFMMTKEEFIGHLKGQAFKYQMRLGKKDDAEQELNKADWYLNYLGKFLTFVKSN